MYKDIKDIAKEVRQGLRTQYPECKWEVRIDRFSGGQSMRVALLAAPFKVFTSDKDSAGNTMRGYAQLNHYQFRSSGVNDGCCNNGSFLTPEAWDCMAEADKIANKDNWNRSEPQVDYFDVNYWLHLEIGRWDKPFTLGGNGK